MAIEAARHGAEPIATAVLPVAYTLHRVAGEVLCDALTGLGLEHGVDADRVWEASRFIDEHVTSQMPALPIPPRITLRTAFNRLPVGLVVRAGRAAADAGRRRPAGRGAGGVQAGAPRLRGAAAGPAGGRHPGRPGRAARAVGAALGRGVARHARLPVRHLRQSTPGDRAGGGRPRRPRRGRRSVPRPRPDAGRGAGRQRGGSAAGGAVRRRRQPAAGQRCAAAAIARMRSATASSAASRSASAS